MRMRSMSCVTVAGVVVALASAGCTVGPDYVRPSAEAPALYKEMPPAKSAEPADTSPKGPWWTVYGDAQLNTLEEGVAAANQNLRVAEANYRQAQTLVQQARAGLYPTIGANVNATRARAASRTQSFYTLGLPVDWEVDLWGKVRRSVEANEASAQASAAELEATLLSLQAQLAQSYFALRIADRDKKLLDETVTAYTRSLELTQNRYKAGVAARSDVVQAETNLNIQREHASLLGKQFQDTQIRFQHGDVTNTDVALVRARLNPAMAEIAVVEGQLAASRAAFEQVVGRPPATLDPAPVLPKTEPNWRVHS